MFFGDDKKKIATQIVGKRDAKGERSMSPTAMKPEEVKTEAGEVDPRHLAAQDVIAALHEQSPLKLMEALGNFIDLHQSHASADEDVNSVDE
jgi:hypothetical protein